MSLEWNYYKLEELINLRTGKLDSNAEEENGNYPFFTCAPDPLKINSFSFDQPAILLAGNNANGNFHINYYEGKFDAYQRTYVIDVLNKEKIDLKFLYYAMKICLKDFKRMSQGTSTRFLTKKILDNFEIQVPNMETQLKIVEVLDAISNKITINTEINKNLLKLSRYLYKEFYIDKVESYDKKQYVTLDDVTSKFATGLNPRKNFVLGEGDNYYVTIKNMANNSIVLDNKCASITDEALIKINKRSDLQVGDLLFSGIGTIGRVHLIDEKPSNWNISESVFTMRPNDLISSEFLFIMLLSQEVQEYAKSLASGSVQKGIRMRDLKAYEFILPTNEDKLALDSLLIPIIADIKSNEKEIRKLTKLRDTLLPKLMSGEIDVSKINCDMQKYVLIILHHLTKIN